MSVLAYTRNTKGLSWENSDFKASLGYIMTVYLNKKEMREGGL